MRLIDVDGHFLEPGLARYGRSKLAAEIPPGVIERIVQGVVGDR
jgi:hypothetical protein